MTLPEKAKALQLQELLKQIQETKNLVEAQRKAEKASKIVEFLINKE